MGCVRNLFGIFILGVCFVAVAAVSAHDQPALQNHFIIHGSVYCDPCRCGFETSASTPLSGVKVRVECRERNNWTLKFEKEAFTNSQGKYRITIGEDHKDQSCKVVLVNSPHPSCNEPNRGRDGATVILTNNNGLTSNIRYANAMGYLVRSPLSFCSTLLKQYIDYDQAL